MSTLTILEFFIGCALTGLGVYAILHEKDLIKFERKAGKYIKAFFKAIVITAKEKKSAPCLVKSLPLGNSEYAQILSDLEKTKRNSNRKKSAKITKLQNIRVA